jgi:hypothetical protein
VNDRMFHVLVLGGLALVGCGGSTAAGSEKGTSDAEPSDATSAEDGFPSETAYEPDAYSFPESSDASMARGDANFPSETAPPPPPPPDAQAPDAGASDASEYADARTPNPGPCVPCEAPAPAP